MVKNLMVVLGLSLWLGGGAMAAESGQSSKSIVKVNGMVCSFCASSIEKKFKKIDNVKDIDVNLDKKIVTITYKDGNPLPEKKIRTIITESGYAISSIENSK